MLGRPYSVEFVVVHGKENGRKMGTPTINQIYPESMCSPLPGVYITRTFVDGVYYPSATGFGPRPTFNGTNLTCETYIKGYDGNLYDREIKVEFFKYLFGARKFDNNGRAWQNDKRCRRLCRRILGGNQYINSALQTAVLVI